MLLRDARHRRRVRAIRTPWYRCWREGIRRGQRVQDAGVVVGVELGILGLLYYMGIPRAGLGDRPEEPRSL